MDTSILHTRIQEYKGKAKNPTSKEMIFLFESWLLSIDNHVSEIEIENYILNNKIIELRELIGLLLDIIIITGNEEKIFLLQVDEKNARNAIDLLMKSRDRVNHKSLSAITALLHINEGKQFESIAQLKEYVAGQ